MGARWVDGHDSMYGIMNETTCTRVITGNHSLGFRENPLVASGAGENLERAVCGAESSISWDCVTLRLDYVVRQQGVICSFCRLPAEFLKRHRVSYQMPNEDLEYLLLTSQYLCTK